MTEADTLTIPAWILSSAFVLAGITSLLAALLNWNWFFNTASATMAGGKKNRTLARWIYGLAGAFMLAAAVIYPL